MITQESADGFIGKIDNNEVSVNSGDQHTITVRNMIMPNLPEGMKMRYSLKARKELNKKRRKREEDPNNRQGAVGGDSISYSPNNPGGSSYNPGGSSNNPGGSSYNPGGSSYNPGGSSNNNPGGSNYNPGGSSYNPGGSSNNNPGGSNYNPGGSSYNPGGSSNNNPGGSNYNPGGSSYNPGGSNYNPGGSNYNPGGWDDHASYRTLATVTLEFTITEADDDFEDDDEPWTKLEYGADSEDETCRVKPGEPNCENEWWWAKFRVQDEDSGLQSIRVSPTGKDTYTHQVYFRHINFPIGTTTEREVYAAASCCIEGMRLTVTDVAGETAERYAVFDGTGSGGLSNTTIYAIIGACVGVVLIIIIVVVVVVCKNKYSEVSQNP